MVAIWNTVQRERRTNDTINGIPVRYGVSRCLRSGLFCPFSVIVPTLGVRMSFAGPEAAAVMRTLTRSPYRVVFESGPGPKVPASWKWVSSFGIRFAVPASWPEKTASRLPSWCAPDPVEGHLPREQVVLVDATSPSPILYCGIFKANDQVRAPYEGLEVITGPYAPRQVGTQSYRTLSLHGLRAAAWASPDSLLHLVVYVHPEVDIELGLSGNGLIARTILASIRPAA